MTDARTAPSGTTVRTPVQLIATVVAVAFLLVGVAGFIPGITTHYSDLSIAGHGSRAELIGVFRVSVLHNLIHLAFGVVGLAMSRTPKAARTYLVVGGVVYAVVWIYGIVIDLHSKANVIPLNSADNWLHLILAAAMIGLGLALGGAGSRRSYR